MPYPILGVLSGFVLMGGWLMTLMALEAYWRMQEPRVVDCPAAGEQAAVRLNAARAHSPRAVAAVPVGHSTKGARTPALRLRQP